MKMKKEKQSRFEILRSENRTEHLAIQEKELLGILTGKSIISGLPTDVIIDHCGYDMMRNGIIVKLLHESFKPVAPGFISPHSSSYNVMKR